MGEDERDEKRLNYTGKRSGSMFIGDGVQNGNWHKILQVSGAAADDALPVVLDGEDNWHCTQLDIQITCEWYNADLFALCAELARIHGSKKPGYVSSASGATVYFGAWKSDKLIRVYHKSHKLVRFEVKFKKNYSDHMARVMIGMSEIERRGYMKAWLRWELNRLNSPLMNLYFSDALNIDPIKPVRMVNREESDRERWIRKVVVPVLHKYANSHDHDPNLLDHIIDVVSKRHTGEPENELPE